MWLSRSARIHPRYGPDASLELPREVRAAREAPTRIRRRAPASAWPSSTRTIKPRPAAPGDPSDLRGRVFHALSAHPPGETRLRRLAVRERLRADPALLAGGARRTNRAMVCFAPACGAGTGGGRRRCGHALVAHHETRAAPRCGGGSGDTSRQDFGEGWPRARDGARDPRPGFPSTRGETACRLVFSVAKLCVATRD